MAHEGNGLHPTPPGHRQVVVTILVVAVIALVFVASGGLFGKSSARPYPSRPAREIPPPAISFRRRARE
jgi:hypothetical protein